MTAAALRARNAAFWAQAAPGWIRPADRQDEIGRPLGAAALDWLRPRPTLGAAACWLITATSPEPTRRQDSRQ